LRFSFLKTIVDHARSVYLDILDIDDIPVAMMICWGEPFHKCFPFEHGGNIAPPYSFKHKEIRVEQKTYFYAMWTRIIYYLFYMRECGRRREISIIRYQSSNSTYFICQDYTNSMGWINVNGYLVYIVGTLFVHINGFNFFVISNSFFLHHPNTH